MRQAAPPAARDSAVIAELAPRDDAAVDATEDAVRAIRGRWTTVERELPTYRCRTIEDERFYFVGGRLVRWLGPDGSAEPVDAEDAGVEAANLLDLARQLAGCALDAAAETCDA